MIRAYSIFVVTDDDRSRSLEPDPLRGQDDIS
jgi:hypothetical protein